MAKYKDIMLGDAFQVKNGMKVACCDCGLVYRYEIFTDENGIIMMRATRDRRATAAIRREDRKRRAKEADDV